MKKILNRIILRNLPLRQRLIAFFSIFIISSGFFVFFMTNRTYEDTLQSQLISYNLDSLKYRCSLLDTKLKIYDSLLMQVFSNSTVQQMLQYSESNTLMAVEYGRKFQNFVYNITTQSSREGIAAIIAVSPSNYFSVFNFDSMFSQYDNSFYREIKEKSGQPAFIDTHSFKFVSRQADRCFGIGRLIRVQALREIGYVVVLVKEEFFSNNLDIPNPEAHAGLYILSETGTVIFSKGPARWASAQFQEGHLDPGTSAWGKVESDNRQYLMIEYRSPYSGWTFVSVVPYESITNTAVGPRNLALLFCTIFLMIAIALSISISRDIIWPIHSLIETMRKVGSGDLTARVHATEGADMAELSAHFNTMVYRVNSLMEENTLKQKELAQAEFEILQSQINPHFLSNTLNTIRWLAIMNGQKQIKIIIDSLSNLLISTFSGEKVMILLKDELDILKSYVQIMMVRYTSLELNLDIPPGFDGCKVLKFMLQPFVENSIIHGFYGISRRGIITISAREDESILVVSVTDNGKGIPPEDVHRLLDGQKYGKSQFSSIGISNVNRRIQLHFGLSYGVTILGNQPEGTIVKIRIPLLR